MNRILVRSAFALFTALPVSQLVQAQAQQQVTVGGPAVTRHAAGLAMERSGNDLGAYQAFLEAAEGGYPPAQRKLGEIYDTGNPAIERDYSESIRWYQKARESGEDIPPPKSRLPLIITP